MPKFISNFNNKLIEHANSSGLNSNNIGMMGTPITVNPVTEQGLTEYLAQTAQTSQQQQQIAAAAAAGIAAAAEAAANARMSLRDLLTNDTTLSSDLKNNLEQTVDTILARSKTDESFITLTAPSVPIYGNSFFPIKVNLISSDLTIDRFLKENPIVWQQDNNAVIKSQESTYTFKAPDNNTTSNIETTINCAYNGALAQIIIRVLPNQTFTSDINTNTLTASLNDTVTNAGDNPAVKSGLTTTNDVILNNLLPSITANQSKSIIISVPPALKTIFTAKYPNLVSTQDIYLSTTKNINGKETLNLSELPSRTDPYNLVIPSLIPNSNINLLLTDGTTLEIYRDLSNRISFNGTDYMPTPTSTTINNKKFTLVGIGSPAVFNVSTPPRQSPHPQTQNTPPPPQTQNTPQPPPSYNPSNILEYIFYLAHPVAFSGAIFYGFVSLVAIDPVSIILNRNWSVAFNIYIGLCAILSIFVWFKIQNPVLPETIFNQNVVAIHL
jgi:hypothetical protein